MYFTFILTCSGILHKAWKLGQEFTILSVSVDIKLVISPTVNDLERSVEVTLRVFLSIVETIAPRILSPIIDISQLKCTMNNADIIVAAKRAPAYKYLKIMILWALIIIYYNYQRHGFE
jgi:hypothetical protein